MQKFPDEQGHFGPYGGTFVSETLMYALEELRTAYERWRGDEEFMRRLDEDLASYVGRPSPVYFARRLTEQCGGARILLKREDLNHTGAHKINNTAGQGLLAKYMGKSRVIAETGAGQHGVATATVAARFNQQCVVYMGETDIDQRVPDAIVGCGSALGHLRFENPQGRPERGNAGLGDQCRRYLLRYRHGCRPPSLSDDGAGFQRRGWA